jgi:hypothetical protein
LAVGYLVGLWPLVGEWLSVLWYFLADSTLVPNWLLALLTICALIASGILGTSLRPTRQTADPEKNDPTD